MKRKAVTQGEHKAKKIRVDENGRLGPPTNGFVTPLLTDFYQLTMAYSYWKVGKHNAKAVFDLFFRKNPFRGEFTIFAGLEEVLRFVSNFRFSDADVTAIKKLLPDVDPKFYEWLTTVDSSQIRVYSVQEGTVMFPRTPLIRVEGPLAVAQLLETTLLLLVNYPSLVCTNAARHRLVVGDNIQLLEFGMRRAQGPDGGMSASRYSYIGGFDGSSNVRAGDLFGISVKGTHAHSYVTSFVSLDEVKSLALPRSGNQTEKEPTNLLELVMKCKAELNYSVATNDSELAAFIAYAHSFPNGFLGLVDTYDTIKSGVRNFLVVALALHKLGYKAIGVRLDSGDLAYLSKKTRSLFVEAAEKCGVDYFKDFTIVASNDITEGTLSSLTAQGHEINAFGIGTNLVTCSLQPALGCVYKLVEINGEPRIKLSQEMIKITIPGRKDVVRLYGKQQHPLVDLLVGADAKVPVVGERVLCRHPFMHRKRAYVTPSKVEKLTRLVFADGKVIGELPTIDQIRKNVREGLAIMREDHLRQLNPTPYKVSVTSHLYEFLHKLWQQESPVQDLES